MDFKVVSKWDEIASDGHRQWLLRFADLPDKLVVVDVNHVKQSSEILLMEIERGYPRVIDTCGKISEAPDSETEFQLCENEIKSKINKTLSRLMSSG